MVRAPMASLPQAFTMGLACWRVEGQLLRGAGVAGSGEVAGAAFRGVAGARGVGVGSEMVLAETAARVDEVACRVVVVADDRVALRVGVPLGDGLRRRTAAEAGSEVVVQDISEDLLRR